MPTAVREFVGTGSPEGAVTAPYGSVYIQTNATTGNEIWDKAAGTGNTGWRVRSAGGGGAPTGTAGGSLAGSYPNPTIAAGVIGGTEVAAAIKDAAAATASMRTLGTGAAQSAAGNDSRLSDTRTPTDGTVTDAKVAAGAAIAKSKLASLSIAIGDEATATVLVVVCTSSTRPASPKTGQMIYQTDTSTALVNTGTPATPVWTQFGQVLSARLVNTTAGELTGGGDLSADRTLGLATISGLTPGSYTSLNATVDGKGRVTAAASGSTSGTGSPEGVVTASPGSQYVQTNAASGNEIWRKVTGTGNTGWRLAPGEGSMVNVLSFGSDWGSATDHTTAIDAAATYAATNSRGLYFPALTYNYSGTGIALWSSPYIKGDGRGRTIIQLGSTSSFINYSGGHNYFYLADMTISGGVNPLRWTASSNTVWGARIIERVAFMDWTSGAAIGKIGTADNPYWMVDNCQFRAANDTATMGVVLNGPSDASVISRNSFEKVCVGVKLIGLSGQDVELRDNSHFRWVSYVSTPRTDIWIVPSTPSTYHEGKGLRLNGVRLSNENLDTNDHRILVADEGTGTDASSKYPATTQSSGVVVGVTIGGGTWVAGAGSTTGPLIRTRTPELYDWQVDVAQYGTLPAEWVHYDYTPTPTSWGGMARATNRLRVRNWQLGYSAIGATVPASNVAGYWQFEDPTNFMTPGEIHSPVSGAGDTADYTSLFTGAASTLLLSSVTTAAATDALGGTDAVEVTYTATGQSVYTSIAPTQGKAAWLELDLRQGATSTVTYAVVSFSLNGTENDARFIRLTPGWSRYRIPIVNQSASNQLIVRTPSTSGKLRLGRVMAYHAREPVNGKQIPVRDTTGLTSAQIDALAGVIPAEGAPPLYDATQKRFLYRAGGVWNYVPSWVQGQGTTPAAITTAQTVANTVTETVLGSITIPANDLVAGTTLRITADGLASTTLTPTITFRVRIGATVLAGNIVVPWAALTTASGIANQPWHLDALVTCRTNGSTGSVIGNGILQNPSTFSTTTSSYANQSATVAVDTTAQRLLGLTAQWGTANAANTLTCHNLLIQVAKP